MSIIWWILTIFLILYFGFNFLIYLFMRNRGLIFTIKDAFKYLFFGTIVFLKEVIHG